MLDIAQEAKLDLNTKDNHECTGFSLACYEFYRLLGRTGEEYMEIIELLMNKAEDLNIDLQAKNDKGKSGFDFLKDDFTSRRLVN